VVLVEEQVQVYQLFRHRDNREDLVAVEVVVVITIANQIFLQVVQVRVFQVKVILVMQVIQRLRIYPTAEQAVVLVEGEYCMVAMDLPAVLQDNQFTMPVGVERAVVLLAHRELRGCLMEMVPHLEAMEGLEA
jgi:hypothetical protein